MRWNRLETGLVVLVASALDRIGEPPAAVHPVVWYGRLIRFLERGTPQSARAQAVYGVAMLLLATPFALFPAWFIQRFAGFARSGTVTELERWNGRILSAIIEGFGLKPCFALYMLAKSGAAVRSALEREDIGTARQALEHLVSRDRSQLTEELAAAAAIESLAENMSDSVVAPLFYYTLLGLPGAALYRLFNTFDSMIGYHGRYEYLGKAAARLDDLLNLLPSRLTALLIIFTAPVYGGRWRSAWQIWRRDARKTTSPNAGHPMAALAGALEVQLEKVDHYRLGEKRKTLSASDIRRAERMVWCVGSITLGLVVLCKILWNKHE